MKNKSGIIHSLPLLLVGVLFVGGIGVAYYFGKNSNSPIISKPSPTPETKLENKMNDWKVYENTKFNYSFKYPQNAQPVERNGTVELNFEYKDESGFFSQFSFTVSVDENTKNMSADKFVDKNDENYLSGENTMVAGVEGYKAIWFGFDHETQSIYLTKEGYIYILSYPSAIPEIPDTHFEEYKKTFDQILSTFEFIETEKEIETPPLSPDTQWSKPKEVTFQTNNPDGLEVNGFSVQSEEIYDSSPIYFDFYVPWLKKNGWTQYSDITGAGEGNEEGWKKGDKYFIFVDDWDLNSIFLYYN